MPLFFLLSALLVVMVLVMLLPVLGRRDSVTEDLDRQQINVAIAKTQLEELQIRLQGNELSNDEFDKERERLERDLASDLELGPETAQQGGGQWMIWPVAALFPLLAGYMYLTIGTPEALDPAALVASEQMQANAQQPTPDMNDVVVRIQERLVEEPNDAKGWFMLGRAHMTLGRFDDAVVAIRRSLELTGDEPEILIRLADAIAMSQQGSMAGEPESLLQRALAIEPQSPQGLWLLGMAQSERGDNAGAIASWKSLLPLLQGDARSETEINQLIARARQQMGGNNNTEAAVASNTESAAMPSGSENQPATSENPSSATAAANSLVVQVKLAGNVAEGLPPNTPVFVYAKATNGPPMPLAVSRRTLGEIPFTITLTDADAMMPAMRLSQFTEVSVGARISLTGDAIARSGDLYGELAIETTSVNDVTVEIADRVE